MGEMRNMFKVLVGKHKGNWQLKRHKRRWKDNIKINLTEIGWGVWWTGYIWLRTGTSSGLL
jgi:hypothetical protein